MAVDRPGKKYLGFVLGDRSAKSCTALWKQAQLEGAEHYMSDYWQAYSEVVPAKKHIRSKAETYTVEGYNSRLRHFLARLRRKTKCYSKCAKMLSYSLLLLMLKLNKQ